MHCEEWALRRPFRIANREWRSSSALVVELSQSGVMGRGEAAGVFYLGETVASMVEQLESVQRAVRNGATRQDLFNLLPAGGARNAVDCAMWDLEAKMTGKSIWQLTGIEPKPLTTVFTIGLEDMPAEMADKAARVPSHPILKVKLDDDRPVQRLTAIRRARPDARIVVDANQSWDFSLLKAIVPECVKLKIEMIEQPLARGSDHELENFESPIPLAADESCLHSGELELAASRYDMVNIKLDKTGGLSEALGLARAAIEKGCKLMVGNMMGTSLAMAPSFVIAQLCDFVDIDGPLLLKHDRQHGLDYRDGRVAVFSARLWG